MYIRTSQGRTEFSNCKSIQLIHEHEGLSIGAWVCNPSQALIEAEDWSLFVPPVPEPTPQTEPTDAEKVIALSKMLSSDVVALDDESALEVIALFPAWIEFIGKDLHVGERYYYNEKLFKVVQDHTAQADWTPELAPALFVRVSVEEFPEWVQPTGVQDAYNTGDKVTYKGEHYVSTMDGNIWSPEAYPAGWNKLS